MMPKNANPHVVDDDWEGKESCLSCGHEFDSNAYSECPRCGWPEEPIDGERVEFEPER